MRTQVLIIIFLIPLLSFQTKAQLPVHYFINYAGEVQLIQITGEPYEMAYYRQKQPLATLRLTKADSANKIVSQQYTFDNGLQKLRTTPSHIDTFTRNGHDFAHNNTIRNNYFINAYPFWQDYDNGLFKADIKKGKYYYEYSYIHYSPSRSTSMPPPGPAGSTREMHTPVISKWYLDSSYRIAHTMQQVKDSNTGRIDSSMYQYDYTASGLIKKVVQTFYLPITNGNKATYKQEVYFFYTAFNKPKYVIAISKNLQEIDEAYCSRLLDTMKTAENINRYVHYQDTPTVAYFAAYSYDTKERLSSCINFDLDEGRTSLTVDSVTYNKDNLPDTVDQFAYNSKDEYGSRTVFIYNKQGKVMETIENNYRQWFRNFKSQVAYLHRNKFTYDTKGRIIYNDSYYDKRIDVGYKYLY